MSENMSENRTLEKLISAHDGDMALLYLFMSSREGATLEDAASALCRTMGQINDAAEKLSRMGIFPTAGAKPQSDAPAASEPPADDSAEDALPEYPSAEIIRCSAEDEAFKAVIQEAARVLGRPVSTGDMQKLMGMYRHLGMPAEVIMELLNYSSELCRVKFGGRRTPTARALEKEAYKWARQELMTMEAAEEYIASRHRVWETVMELKGVFGLTDKPLTTADWNFLEHWLALGFDVPAIALAYERTLAQTGSLKWPYMNSIIKNWHEKGLHSVEMIERVEGARKSAPVTTAAEAGSSSQSEKAKKFMKALQNGGNIHGV